MKIIDSNKINNEIKYLKNALESKKQEQIYYNEELEHIKKQNINLTNEVKLFESAIRSHKWRIWEANVLPEKRRNIINEILPMLEKRITETELLDSYTFVHDSLPFLQNPTEEVKKKVVSNTEYNNLTNTLKQITYKINITMLENKNIREQIKFEYDKKERLTKEYNSYYMIIKHLKNIFTESSKQSSDKNKINKALNVLLYLTK